LRFNQPIIIQWAKLRTRVDEGDGGKRELGPGYSYSSSIRGSLVRTVSMGWTAISLTTPSRWARMLCSIFMASTTQTSWPAETWSPGRTKMEITRPDRGDAMMLSELLPEALRAEGGGAMIPADWVRPRRGRAGGWLRRPSTSTRKVSPSTVTSTGDWVSSLISTLYQLSPTLIRSVVTANSGSPLTGIGVAPGARKRARD